LNPQPLHDPPDTRKQIDLTAAEPAAVSAGRALD